VSDLAAFRDQIIGTAILVFLIMAIASVRSTPPLANLAPFIIGLLVVAIGMAWGTLDGYAINPARDFGPRLASYLTGYSGAWRDQYGHLFFWVPIAGPLIGAVVGGGLFALFYQRNLPDEEHADGAPEEPGRLPVEPAMGEHASTDESQPATREPVSTNHQTGVRHG
jgi:glycerol uptake facilitator protein